jgi:hypothetical protein
VPPYVGKEQSMKYSTLGKTGETVSRIGFGGAPAGLANYLLTLIDAQDCIHLTSRTASSVILTLIIKWEWVYADLWDKNWTGGQLELECAAN